MPQTSLPPPQDLAVPELPDVEVYRARLESALVGRKLRKVDGGSAAEALPGRALASVNRRGKYVLLEFAGPGVLVLHLGPAGALSLGTTDGSPPAYLRLRLAFDDGQTLDFTDKRRLGQFHLVDSTAAFIAEKRLGPDALDPALDGAALVERLSSRSAIKLALTDQTRIAGIGNTYSDEILFQARLHPALPTNSLSHAQATALLRVIRRVLKISIARDPTAEGFRARLPRGYLLPQRHAGGHCPRCGTELEQLRLPGHAATFCPKCQALPG